MAYPTSRTLNDRLHKRGVLKPSEPSPPFSPGPAIAKLSRIPVLASPTSNSATPLASPQKPLYSPKKVSAADESSQKATENSQRLPLKRADDSWLRRKGDAGGATAAGRKPSEVKAMHARKRSGTLPTRTSSKEALVMPPRKHSELPNTLLRKHVLAREGSAGNKEPDSTRESQHSNGPRKSSTGSALPLRKYSSSRSSIPQITVPYKSTISSSSPISPTTHSPMKPVPSPSIEAGLLTPDTTQTQPGHTCKRKGHPYTSHFIPYICGPCVAESQKRERDRRQRLATSLADDGLIDRVRLAEWQWRGRQFRAGGKMQDSPELTADHFRQTADITVPAAGAEESVKSGRKESVWVIEPETPRTTNEQTRLKQEAKMLAEEACRSQDEHRRLKEEAAMLAKMEEANNMIEQETQARRRRSAGDSKGKKQTEGASWMDGWRRSVGSEGKAEKDGQNLTGGSMKGRASWRVTRVEF